MMVIVFGTPCCFDVAVYILPSVLLYILPYLDYTEADQREAQTSRYDKEGRPPCPNTA